MKIYHVGGSVRAVLLERHVTDLDYLVTGATEQEMLDLGFERVGAAFPVFLHPVTRREYALARREHKTGIGYLGFECEFDTDVTVEEDLRRRDLTINSIAYDDVNGTYIDPFNGMKDLHDKVLRHTSDAFAEDPLRVIRLARFYARYSDFTIAPETIKLAQKIVASGEMDALPMERYWEELRKVFKDSPDQIGRFLEALEMMNATSGAFFNDVIGTWCAHICTYMYGDAISKIEDPDLAMAVFVTLYGDSAAPLAHPAIPLRVKTLISDFEFTYANEDKPPAEFLYAVLDKTRSLNGETVRLHDLCSCWNATLTTKGYANLLIDAVTITSQISAEPYIHLQGKEIGAAMKAARIKAIKEMINK